MARKPAPQGQRHRTSEVNCYSVELGGDLQIILATLFCETRFSSPLPRVLCVQVVSVMCFFALSFSARLPSLLRQRNRPLRPRVQRSPAYPGRAAFALASVRARTARRVSPF